MEGEILAGRYRIVRLLGQGGMGSVYEATHTQTGRRVAVKVITAGDLTKGDPRVLRFAREARAAGALVSDHIAGVLDAGEDPVTGAPFMVMEYLEGEDLLHLLKRNGPLRPDAALRIVAQACLGLQKAHEAGVVHRDIKPANLFLCRRDEGAVLVKLLDFGIAKIRHDDTVDAHTPLTSTGNVLGSPHYLSPEQARASRDVDPRTDVWSLGVTLYRALTGRTPHEKLDSFINLMMAICLQPPPPVQSFAPWVPPEIADVVHGALVIDRDERFPSAAAMLDAIRPLLREGWALHESMLVPLDAGDRARVAPESLRRPETAPIAAITASLGVISIPPPAAVTPPPTATAPALARPRSRRTVKLGAVGAAALAGTAVVVALLAARLPGGSGDRTPTVLRAEPTAAPISSAPPRPAATAEAPAPRVEATKRVKLVIEPSDATAEVDGAPALSPRGVVELEGPLGSIHRVRLRKGKGELVDDVAITESGALPPKLELVAIPPPRAPSGPAATASAAPAAPALPAPTSAKLRTSFE